jgi:hypothetical protein
LSAVLVASADSPPAGNGVYTVFVEDEQSVDGIGTFTVMTGPRHPTGDGQEILLNRDGPGDAATSYLTVRSYTTGVDYVQTTSDVFSANIVYPLDPFGESIPTSENGYITTYHVSEYDQLTIESQIHAVGGITYESSVVELKASVINTGTTPVVIGLRYLLDLAPGSDDGPVIQRPPDPEPIGTEADLGSLPAYLNVLPNGGQRDVTFSLFGRSSTPLAGLSAPTVKFVAWQSAFESAFDYQTSGVDVASEAGPNDSAALYYVGDTPSTAATLLPGEGMILEVHLGPEKSGQEDCSNAVDDDGDGLVDSVDPDCLGPTPTPTPAPPPGLESPTPTPAMTPAELPHTGGRRR